MRVAAVAALILVLGVGCDSHRRVAITVAPARSTEAQPIDIRVSGLPAKRMVSLTIRSTDALGAHFSATGRYRADGRGRIDLARTPAAGDDLYPGTWEMGLLVSMAAPHDPGLLYEFGSSPRRFYVTAHVAGKQVAVSSFLRSLSPVPLAERRLTVARDGFQGGFATPKGAIRRPAVLELGGSEGGAKPPDRLFAASGVPTLYVGYFHGPGLPDRLLNIPLEYFRKALMWLDRQPEVDPSRVTVLGTSYGSEAALLLGVHYPRLVHAVGAVVTSDVSTCGIVGAKRFNAAACLGPAWTLHGHAIPYTKQWDNPHPTDVPAAVIPVERIRGPILLTCGGLDQLWASCPYARAIVARLKAHHFGYAYKLYAYPGASHFGAQVFRFRAGHARP